MCSVSPFHIGTGLDFVRADVFCCTVRGRKRWIILVSCKTKQKEQIYRRILFLNDRSQKAFGGEVVVLE